jgi:SAM-dependent methyltransferase
MKRALPSLDLVGGDLVPGILEECRRNPALGGIRFECMDVLDLGKREEFDVIVVNAVLYLLEEGAVEKAFREMAEALRPGGTLVVFDFFHPWEQELAIVEKSKTHPSGLKLHFRPYSQVRKICEREGLGTLRFTPFQIPIDLDRPMELDDIRTYTVRTEVEERMNFRGSLFQPWCYLVAQKDGKGTCRES